MPDNIVEQAMKRHATYDETEHGISFKYYEVGGLLAAFERIKQHHEDNWRSMLDEGAIELLNQLISSLK